MTKKEILLASISGLLMPLAFPNFNLSFIAWIGLVPLISAVFKSSPAKGLLLSTITGTIFHLGLVYWVTVSMTSYGKLPLAVSILVLILFRFCAEYIHQHSNLFKLLCKKAFKLFISSYPAPVLDSFRIYKVMVFDRVHLGKPRIFTIQCSSGDPDC